MLRNGEEVHTLSMASSSVPSGQGSCSTLAWTAMALWTCIMNQTLRTLCLSCSSCGQQMPGASTPTVGTRPPRCAPLASIVKATLCTVRPHCVYVVCYARVCTLLRAIWTRVAWHSRIQTIRIYAILYCGVAWTSLTILGAACVRLAMFRLHCTEVRQMFHATASAVSAREMLHASLWPIALCCDKLEIGCSACSCMCTLPISAERLQHRQILVVPVSFNGIGWLQPGTAISVAGPELDTFSAGPESSPLPSARLHVARRGWLPSCFWFLMWVERRRTGTRRLPKSSEAATSKDSTCSKEMTAVRWSTSPV